MVSSRDFFSDGVAEGGYLYSRTELLSRIEDLYGRIDEENEKRDELRAELQRTERAIARFRDLVSEMEASIR